MDHRRDQAESLQITLLRISQEMSMHASIYTRAAEALTVLEGATELKNFLVRVEELNVLVDGKIRLTADASDTQAINAEVRDLKGLVLLLPNIARSVDIRVMFRDIETVHEMLSHVFSGTKEPDAIEEFVRRLDRLADLYNDYLRTPTAEASVELLRQARQTMAAFDTLASLLEYVVANSSDVEPQEGESEFSLDLFYTSDLDDFAQRLSAISRIYRELAELLNAPMTSLRVAKIESGSLLTRLVGDTRVVGLLVDVTRDSVQYFQRNVTREGKIASIAPKVEAIEKVLELSKKLEDAGVDIGGMREQLGKSAHSLAENLTRLLADQPTVSLNGDEMSVTAEMTKLMLQNSRSHLRLPAAETRIDPTLDDACGATIWLRGARQSG